MQGRAASPARRMRGLGCSWDDWLHAEKQESMYNESGITQHPSGLRPQHPGRCDGTRGPVATPPLCPCRCGEGWRCRAVRGVQLHNEIGCGRRNPVGFLVKWCERPATRPPVLDARAPRGTGLPSPPQKPA